MLSEHQVTEVLSLYLKRHLFILTEIFLITGLPLLTNFKILRKLDRG